MRSQAEFAALWVWSASLKGTACPRWLLTPTTLAITRENCTRLTRIPCALCLCLVTPCTRRSQVHMHTRTCNGHAHAYVTPVFAKAAAARACSHTYCYHPPRRVLRRGPQQMACSCSCSSPRDHRGRRRRPRRAQAHRRAGTEESVRLNTQPKSTQARLTLIKLDTYVWVATKYCMGSRLQRRWASEDKAVELLSCITIVSRAMSPEERPSRGVLTLPAAGNAPAVRPMISTEECPLGKAETARRPLSRLGVGAAARHD